MLGWFSLTGNRASPPASTICSKRVRCARKVSPVATRPTIVTCLIAAGSCPVPALQPNAPLVCVPRPPAHVPPHRAPSTLGAAKPHTSSVPAGSPMLPIPGLAFLVLPPQCAIANRLRAPRSNSTIHNPSNTSIGYGGYFREPSLRSSQARKFRHRVPQTPRSHLLDSRAGRHHGTHSRCWYPPVLPSTLSHRRP